MRNLRSSLGATALVLALSVPAVAQDESTTPEVNPGDKIGISLIATTDTNTVNAMTAFKARAEADGWEIIEVDTQGAQDNANTAIESFVNQGVKGIMSTIYPPDALQAGITAANEAGIPVVGHFSGDGPGVAAFSSSGGDEQMTQLMVDTMGGTGQVLAFTYRPGKPCLEREDVFDAVMANYPDIQVTKQEGEFPEYVQSTADAARGWIDLSSQGRGQLRHLGLLGGLRPRGDPGHEGVGTRRRADLRLQRRLRWTGRGARGLADRDHLVRQSQGRQR